MRQVLDIDVDESGLVVLESSLRRRRAIVLLDQVAQVRHTMAAKAASQARARDGWIDELTCD